MADMLEAGSPNLQPPNPSPDNTPPPHKNRVKVEDVAVCASPGEFAPTSLKRRKMDHEEETIGSALRKFLLQHQLGLSVNFVLLLGLTHVLFPSLRQTIKAFFTLSYPLLGREGMYGLGSQDFYLVASCVVYFTALRALILDYVLLPLAGFFGIEKRKGKTRFAEQSHLLLYYWVYWPWGLWLLVQGTPTDVHSIEDFLVSLWQDFPQLNIATGMKIYYLSQLAFWIQQVVVIHIEERRRDHYQMLSHHFITIGLMVGSYWYRQWRVGNAILVCMDIVDLILPLAKILRYLSMQAACDAAFVFFVLIWVAARHVAYLTICWSIYAHVNTHAMPYGQYSTISGERLSSDGGNNIFENLFQPMLQPDAKTISFNANIRWSFLGLLLLLQCITIAWLLMIVKIIVGVVRGNPPEDIRSDDEGDEEDETIDEVGPAQPSVPLALPVELEKSRFIEIETSSEEVAWPVSRGSGSRKKTKGISSGLNLGDHKEILNRIGCLSEEQLAREREKREGSSSPRPPSSSKR